MNEQVAASYQEGLKELVGQLGEMLPASALETFNRDAANLASAHPLPLKLNPGDKAPDFSLPNALGETIRLSDFLAHGSVVLVFYRGAWCPYCNLQLSLYQQVIEEIESAGARLLAVSPQTADASLSLSEKQGLRFEVLSDVGNVVARQYTTVFRNADAPVRAMTGLGFDFDGHYADDSREIPVPAVFIISREGLVTFARSEGGDYRMRVEPADILKALKEG